MLATSGDVIESGSLICHAGTTVPAPIDSLAKATPLFACLRAWISGGFPLAAAAADKLGCNSVDHGRNGRTRKKRALQPESRQMRGRREASDATGLARSIPRLHLITIRR